MKHGAIEDESSRNHDKILFVCVCVLTYVCVFRFFYIFCFNLNYFVILLPVLFVFIDGIKYKLYNN